MPYADVVYDIARYSDGEIPADLHYAPKNLARIDTTYHGQKEDAGRVPRTTSCRVRSTARATSDAARARHGARGVGQHRPGALEPGCRRRVGPVGDARHAAHLQARSSKLEVEYFGGIVRPVRRPRATGCPTASSDYAQINIPGWADGGDAMHTGAFDTYDGAVDRQAADRRLHRRRAGRAVRLPGRATCTDLPDGEQDWRVVSTATHDGSHLAGSTKTVSEWTFRSDGQARTTGRIGCCR